MDHTEFYILEIFDAEFGWIKVREVGVSKATHIVKFTTHQAARAYLDCHFPGKTGRLIGVIMTMYPVEVTA